MSLFRLDARPAPGPELMISSPLCMEFRSCSLAANNDVVRGREDIQI
jgi:hypothetical protein